MNRRYFNRKFNPSLRPFPRFPILVAVANLFFLLLIFVMISSMYVQVSGIAVTLPELHMPGSARVERFIITITAAGEGDQIYFNDQPLSMDKLAEQLARTRDVSHSKAVVVRADRKASNETLMKVWNLATRAGLSVFMAAAAENGSTETTFGEH